MLLGYCACLFFHIAKSPSCLVSIIKQAEQIKHTLTHTHAYTPMTCTNMLTTHTQRPSGFWLVDKNGLQWKKEVCLHLSASLRKPRRPLGLSGWHRISKDCICWDEITERLTFPASHLVVPHWVLCVSF